MLETETYFWMMSRLDYILPVFMIFGLSADQDIPRSTSKHDLKYRSMNKVMKLIDVCKSAGTADGSWKERHDAGRSSSSSVAFKPKQRAILLEAKREARLLL